MTTTQHVGLPELFAAGEDYRRKVIQWEDSHSFLLWTTDYRTYSFARYQPGMGGLVGDIARFLTFTYEAKAAVLVFEAWYAEDTIDPDESIEDIERRMLSGEEPLPSERPESERRDVVVLFGETPDGHHQERTYYIEGSPGRRRFVPRENPPGEKRGMGNILPLFSNDRVAHLRTAAAMLATDTEIEAFTGGIPKRPFEAGL